jgi:adenylate cyclase
LADLAFEVHEQVYEAASGRERLAAARRLLALDPLRESAHRAVMAALAAAGERDQALRQYETLRDMLARELEARPSAESERLKAAIAAGEVAATDTLPARQREAVEVRDEPTIAVLPFTSLSDDPEREFFADGMSDSIISTLSKIPYVRVIARASTQIYKGRAVDVREVGREQGVRYVLDGTVKSAGERLRITVQLSDTETGQHVWSEKYERTIGDIFALQDEITMHVVVALDVELRDGEQALFRAGGTRSLEAWEHQLQAHKHVSAHQRDAWPAARRAIDRALKLDPDNGMVWTVLGWWHWEQAFCGWSADPDASIVAALEAADRACRLDPLNPEPHLVLAMAHLQRRDFDEADVCMLEARRLGPNHAMVPAIGANVSMFADRPAEALRQSRQAIRLCPIYPPWYAGDAAQACLQLRRLDDAIGWARAAIRRSEGFIHAHLFLVVAYHEQGKAAEARAAAEGALKADPAFSAKAWATAQPFKDTSINQRFLTALIAAGLPA